MGDDECFTHVQIPANNTYWWQSTTIKSKGWPKNYTDNQDCVWILETSDNFRISFRIDFDIEESPNCFYDRIMLYDGEFILYHV